MLINPPCTICLTHSHCSKYDAICTAQYLHACPHPCMRVPRHEVCGISDEIHGKSVLSSPGIVPRASLHDQASELQGRLATLRSLFLLHPKQLQAQQQPLSPNQQEITHWQQQLLRTLVAAGATAQAEVWPGQGHQKLLPEGPKALFEQPTMAR